MKKANSVTRIRIGSRNWTNAGLGHDDGRYVRLLELVEEVRRV